MARKFRKRLTLEGVPELTAYVIGTKRTIAPFNDPVAETLLGNKTLRARQTETLGEARCKVQFVDRLPEAPALPCIVTFDYVFFSFVLFEQFLAAATRSAKNCVLCFEKSVSTQFARPLMDIGEEQDPSGRTLYLYDIFYLAKAPTGAPAEPEKLPAFLRAQSTRLIVPSQEITFRMRMPRVEGARDVIEVPLTARVAGHVRHWVHVLWLNQLTIGLELWEYIRHNRRRFRMIALKTLVFTFLREFKLNKVLIVFNALRSLNVIGKRTFVHPTAQLSGCFIGDDVIIGPGVRLRHTIVGSRTEITEDCSINNSVIGDDCLVMRNTYMTACVSFPGSTLGNYKVQACLFGRNVFLTTSCAMVDAKFNGNVRVEMDGKFEDCGTPFIGSCVGHGVMLGAHVTVQAGRTIPNGYQIVTNPERILAKISPNLPTGQPLVVVNGELVPLKSPGG